MKNYISDDNWGKPSLKEEFKIDGFATKLSLPGEAAYFIQKSILTSYSIDFPNYIKNIIQFAKCGEPNNLLIRIDKNNTAKIFADNFPMMQLMMIKKDINKFGLVYEDDIVDITEVSFKDDVVDCSIQDGEKVIWIFRKSYSFGLYFDLTGKLNAEVARKEMADAFKNLSYFSFYKSLEDEQYRRLLELGWFPFIRIMGARYNELFSYISSKKEHAIDSWIEQHFTKNYIEKFTEKWWRKESFKSKKTIIESGLKCFYDKNYPACISTLTPMIEGVANEAFLKDPKNHSKKPLGTKGKDTIKFLHAKSIEKFTSNFSLALPHKFKEYLDEFFFKSGMQQSNLSKANRHPIAHGRADSDSYQIERAIQTILTLDQMAFYL
jgi:hypothetical protein